MKTIKIVYVDGTVKENQANIGLKLIENSKERKNGRTTTRKIYYNYL